MPKSTLVVLGILAAILGFLFINDLMAVMKPLPPKVIIVTPNIVVRPVPPAVNTPLVVPAPPVNKKPAGLLHKLHKLFGGK